MLKITERIQEPKFLPASFLKFFRCIIFLQRFNTWIEFLSETRFQVLKYIELNIFQFRRRDSNTFAFVNIFEIKLLRSLLTTTEDFKH